MGKDKKKLRSFDAPSRTSNDTFALVSILWSLHYEDMRVGCVYMSDFVSQP